MEELMTISCLCLVEDEAERIQHIFDAAVEGAKHNTACDNSSTDGAWEFLEKYDASQCSTSRTLTWRRTNWIPRVGGAGGTRGQLGHPRVERTNDHE